MNVRSTLAALGFAAAACAPAKDEAPVGLARQAEPAQPSVALAQANAAKPLIHVWKSPT